MAKDVFVRIRGEDSLSPVLKKVGAAAKSTAADLKGLDNAAKDSGDAAKQAGQSFKDYDQELRQVGVGAGILVAGLAMSGQAFRDQEIGLNNLQRSYGDAADDMKRWADQLQETTNFSNDAGVAAANTAATLARNYGFTADEIQQVLDISADLAAANGKTLEYSVQAVTAALRGEAEMAEQVGLTMNQAAIDSQGLTLTMSNQEAGHFRLKAAIEQSAYAQGAAAEQADTFYGSLTQVKDEVQDMAQAAAGALGPVADLGAFAADNAVQLAAMGLAAGQFAKTADGLSKMLTGVGAASNLLSLAMGPAGIVAAVGLASVGIGALARYLSSDYNSAVDEASTATQNFTDNLISMGQAGTLSMLNQAIAQRGLIISQYGEDLAAADEDTHNFIESMRSVQTQLSGPGGVINAHVESVTDALTEAQIAFIDGIQVVNGAIVQGNEDGILSFEELQLAMSNTDQVMANTGETAQEYAAAWDSAQSDIASIMSDTSEAGIEAQKKLLKTFKNVGDGLQTMGGAAKTIDQIEKDMQSATAAAIANGEAVDQNTASLVKWLDAGGDVHTLTDDIATSMQDMGEASVALGTKLADNFWDPFDLRAVNALDDTAKSMASMGGMSVNMGTQGDSGAFDVAFQGVKAGANDAKAAQEGLARGIANASDAMTYQVGESQRLAAELAKDAEAVAKLGTQYAETFGQMQASATQATDTLDDVFRGIVGNTDAIASQSQAVMDWADGLIGAAGTVGEIDQLLADGAITLDDYTAAQSAYNDIAAANASIQQDVLSIQTQLAPVVAQSTEALAEQMDAIANGSTDAQLFALGMMDAATSSQALALAQGYLADQDVFGPMIQSAAELNPMLAQILEEMGLISYNPATGVVELIGAEESQSELAMLTDAMTQLDQTVANLTAVLQDDASGPIADVQSAADELGATVATPTVSVIDSASGTLSSIAGLLAGLQDRTVTVTTINQTLNPFAANGGMIARANGGSIPFVGAEGTGFELMRRGDGGGLQMLPSPGVYNAPQGSMVFPHGASMSMMDNMGGGGGITVNVAGSVYGVDDLTATVAAAVAEGMVISRQRYVRGQAV